MCVCVCVVLCLFSCCVCACLWRGRTRLCVALVPPLCLPLVKFEWLPPDSPPTTCNTRTPTPRDFELTTVSFLPGSTQFVDRGQGKRRQPPRRAAAQSVEPTEYCQMGRACRPTRSRTVVVHHFSIDLVRLVWERGRARTRARHQRRPGAAAAHAHGQRPGPWTLSRPTT